MNVTLENTDTLNAVLSVKIEQNDYEPKVEQSLKDLRKKAVIKGFRPGKAPASLINKLYFKSALLDEVNKLVSENISKYITEKELKILGEPLPSEKQEDIDWDTQKDFHFKFDLAFAPEFELNLSKRDKVPYYNIKVDKKMRESYTKSILAQQGSYQPAEVADGDSLITATLTELNSDESPKEDGITVEDALISVMLVSNDEDKDKLIGTKIGDVVTVDVQKSFPNETDRAALLKIDKDNLQDIEPLFQATITEVKKYVNAEINQEFYDKLFGEGVVTTEEEFNKRIEEDIKRNLSVESDRRFFVDARDKLIDKFKIELPKDFLIRWLVAINEGKYTREKIQEDFPSFEKDLKWQLIRNKIIQENELKAEKEEVLGMAKAYIGQQMAQYGMGQLPEQFMDKYANDLIEKDEERSKLAERVLENKTIDWVKEAVKLDEKDIDFEKFKELVNS